MKTKFIIIFITLVITFSSFSQIKIFPGGSVTIGATTSPTANSVMHQIVGSKVAFPGTTSAATSAPLIVGQNAVSSSPGFAFLGDHQTGIAHPAASVLAITIANSEKFRFNSSGQILNSNGSSSASTPDFSWNSDPNTGMYRSNSDNLSFSTGGSERMRINDVGQIFSCVSGSASWPNFSWSGDMNTGMFSPGADILAFTTGGSERFRINGYGHAMLGTTVDNSMLSITSTDYKSAYFDVTLNTDWWNTMTTRVNRSNSSNYLVDLVGTGTTFYVAGAGWIYSQGNYLGSDKNIKDDIKNIDSASKKINMLNGVTYKLKKEIQNPSVYGAAKEYMGVIAQDVEAVAPQAVKNLPDGTKAVCYEMLVGLLIEALKEQNAKVQQLENSVNACCNKNNQRINTTEDKSEFGINEEYAGASYIKQNVPNPFNKETNIEYFIAERSAISSILIFDMNGKLLKTYKINVGGPGNLNIAGNELAAGMYYYSLIVNTKEVGTKKMILTE